jgi:hypothetical protein
MLKLGSFSSYLLAVVTLTGWIRSPSLLFSLRCQVATTSPERQQRGDALARAPSWAFGTLSALFHTAGATIDDVEAGAHRSGLIVRQGLRQAAGVKRGGLREMRDELTVAIKGVVEFV